MVFKSRRLSRTDLRQCHRMKLVIRLKPARMAVAAASFSVEQAHANFGLFWQFSLTSHRAIEEAVIRAPLERDKVRDYVGNCRERNFIIRR